MNKIFFMLSIFVLVKVSLQNTNNTKLTLADDILNKLQSANWNENEASCIETTKKLLEHAKNHTLWASWVLDSMQLPTGVMYGSRYHLGNFDQCLDDVWTQEHPELEMQYCLVDVTSPTSSTQKQFHAYDDVKEFLSTKSRYGKRLNLNSVGVCLPSICSHQAVEKISQYIISSSLVPYGDVKVDPRDCQRNSDNYEYSKGYYLFWFSITVLSIIATAVYMFEDHITDPKLSEIASWFSPSKNFASLTSMSGDEVRVVNGMRAFSAGTSVVMHYFLYNNRLAVINHHKVGKHMETNVGKSLVHFELFIGSFFVLSGFLNFKGLYSSRSINPYKMILKRYLRLLPLLAFVIFYLVTVSSHFGSGPLWPRFLKEHQQPCVRNWWKTIFMMGNWIHDDDPCHEVTWYLACDFQLTVIGIIMFCFWTNNRRKGVIALAIAFGVSTILPIFLASWNKLSPILMHDLDQAMDTKMNKAYILIYSKIWGAGNSYFIGLVLGFIMSTYKPEKNRNIISKKWSIIISLAIGYITLTMLQSVGQFIFKPYDSFLYAIWAGVDKPIWAISLSILLMVCEYGTLPIVTDFLTSKVFVALSRLSYGIYLIHTAVMFSTVYSLRAPLTYDFFHMLVNGLGHVVISYVISYLQWFIIEAPASNMFNYLLKNKKIKTEHKHENGNGKIRDKLRYIN